MKSLNIKHLIDQLTGQKALESLKSQLSADVDPYDVAMDELDKRYQVLRDIGISLDKEIAIETHRLRQVDNIYRKV